jgi:probable aminopeptidase NPEPL1
VDVSFFVESKDREITQDKLDSLAIVADSIRLSQSLTDTPPNELNTTSYIEFIQKVITSLNAGVDVKVIQGRDLDTQGFGGLWAVGKGNTTNPPALVVLTKKAKLTDPSTQSLVLVGKGIVYDSGGLSLKQTPNMCGMKSDMTGSGSMFASFVALVKMGGLKNENLHCILCLAENSVGPDSFRNDDILKMYSGLTVEINNTDAEGRLVLSDGCAYAVKHLNPKLVIDMATLTGAQGVATGQNHAAILSSFEDEESGLVSSGKISGDLAFPIVYCPEFHKPLFKSEVADMKNSVSNRIDATASASGWFIYENMNAAGYSGRWAHIDMAGPATFSSTGRGTGYGVGLICSYLRPDILI